MSQPTITGLTPALPWPLKKWTWMTEPVRAERLAALRIGVAIVLLLDVLGTYLPRAGDFFGQNSLGSPEVFTGTHVWWRWSLLRGIGDPGILQAGLILWAVAGVGLLLGVVPRLSAGFAWLMSVSIIGINYYLHNSGDNVRTIVLFYLMLSPCGAVWSLGKRQPSANGKHYVSAWPLRLLLVQMACIYFFNGLYKISGPDWRDGNILHLVLGNVGWTRIAYAQLPLPYTMTQFMTWNVLVWELSFPLLVMIPWLRKSALWMGVMFHLGTAVLLQLSAFPFYMLCLYLPLVPWEQYIDRRRQQVLPQPEPASVDQAA